MDRNKENRPASPAKKPACKKTVRTVLTAAILACLLLGLSACSGINLGVGGSRNDPLKVAEKLYNSKSIKIETLVDELLNGVDGGYVSEIVKIMKKSDELCDYVDDLEDEFSEYYENVSDYCGKNFKLKFLYDEIEDYYEYSRSDLKYQRDEIRDLADECLDFAEEFRDYKSSEIRELAEDLDLSTGDLKKLVSYFEKLGNKLADADVSEGYELEIEAKATGSNLDEPEEITLDFDVFKVNGKWISDLSLYVLEEIVDCIN